MNAIMIATLLVIFSSLSRSYASCSSLVLLGMVESVRNASCCLYKDNLPSLLYLHENVWWLQNAGWHF